MNKKIKKLQTQLLEMNDLYGVLKKNPKNKLKAQSCLQNIQSLKLQIQKLKKSIQFININECSDICVLQKQYQSRLQIHNLSNIEQINIKQQNLKRQLQKKGTSKNQIEQIKQELKELQYMKQLNKKIINGKKKIKTTYKDMIHRKKQLQLQLNDMNLKDIKQGKQQILLLQNSISKFSSNPKLIKQIGSLKLQVQELRNIIKEWQRIERLLSDDNKQQGRRRRIKELKNEQEKWLKELKIVDMKEVRLIIKGMERSLDYLCRREQTIDLTNELKVQLQRLRRVLILDRKIQKYQKKLNQNNKINYKKQLKQLRLLMAKYFAQLNINNIKQAISQYQSLQKTIKTITLSQKPNLYHQIQTQISNLHKLIQLHHKISQIQSKFGLNTHTKIKSEYQQLSSAISTIPNPTQIDKQINKIQDILKMYNKKQEQQRQYKQKLKQLKELKQKVRRMDEIEIELKSNIYEQQSIQQDQQQQQQESQNEEIHEFEIFESPTGNKNIEYRNILNDNKQIIIKQRKKEQKQEIQNNIQQIIKQQKKTDNLLKQQPINKPDHQNYYQLQKISQIIPIKENINQSNIKPSIQQNQNISVKIYHLDKFLQLQIPRNQPLKNLIQKSNHLLNIQSSPQKMKFVNQNDQIIDQNKTIQQTLLPNPKLRLTKPTNKFQILPQKVQFLKEQIINNMNQFQLEGDLQQNFSKQIQDDPKKVGILATKVLYQVSEDNDYSIKSIPVEIQVQGKMTQVLPNGKSVSFSGTRNLIQIKYDVGNKKTKQIKQQCRHFNRKNMNPQIVQNGIKINQRLIGENQVIPFNQSIKDLQAQNKINLISQNIIKKEKSKLYQYNKMAFNNGNTSDLKSDVKLAEKAQQTLRKIGIFTKLDPNTVNRKYKTTSKCNLIYPSRKIQTKTLHQQLFQIRNQQGKPYYFSNPQLFPVYIQTQIPRYLRQRLEYQHKMIRSKRLSLKNNDYDTRYLLYSPEAIKNKRVCIVEYYKQDHQYFHMNVLKQAGFIVDYHTRFNRSMLKQQYDLIWVISSGTNRIFKQGELNFYVQAHRKGVGLFLWGDNQPYFFQANAILNQLFKGFQLTGNYYGTNTLIVATDVKNGNFDANHPVSAGFVRLYEGNTICYPNSTHPQINVFAYNTETKVLQASLLYRNRRQNEGNIWIDSGFTKLYPSCNEFYKQEVKRYIINVSSYIAKKYKI